MYKYSSIEIKKIDDMLEESLIDFGDEWYNEYADPDFQIDSDKEVKRKWGSFLKVRKIKVKDFRKKIFLMWEMNKIRLKNYGLKFWYKTIKNVFIYCSGSRSFSMCVVLAYENPTLRRLTVKILKNIYFRF